MALTTYDGTTCPFCAQTVFGVSPGLYGTGSSSNAATASRTTTEGFGLVQPNDCIVVCFTVGSTTATVSSVTSQVGSLTWTNKAALTLGSNKFYVYIGQNLTGSAISYLGTITVTLSASVAWSMTALQVTNITSIDATVGTASSGSTTNLSLTGAAYTHDNAFVMFAAGFVSTSATNNQSDYRAVPGIIATAAEQSLVSSNYYTSNFYTSQWLGAKSGPAAMYNPKFSTGTAVGLVQLYFYGPTIKLDDFTYLIGEPNGTLLNNPANTLPLIDVSDVQGLTDMNITAGNDPIDGSDGSYVFAKYATGHTVVIDGTIYTSSPFDETVLDGIKQNLSPPANPAVSGPIPFFYKLPNRNPRKLFVYPSKFVSDQARERALAQADYQIQLMSPDARSYDPTQTASSGNGTSGLYGVTVTPTGNCETFPRIYFNLANGEGTGTATIIFYAVTWAGAFPILQQGAPTVQINIPALGAITDAFSAVLCLDLYNRALLLHTAASTLEYIEYPGLINPIPDWFSLIPGIPNTIFMQRSISTINDAPFEIQYAGAFR